MHVGYPEKTSFSINPQRQAAPPPRPAKIQPRMVIVTYCICFYNLNVLHGIRNKNAPVSIGVVYLENYLDTLMPYKTIR